MGRKTPAGFDDALRRERGASLLAGVDEAGRGPLAGPVVVAAVLLGPGPHRALAGVRDSKVLSAARREALFPVIAASARALSLAWAHPAAIDENNILRATLLAMRRAVLRLPEPGLVLVDGPRPIPDLARRQITVVDGDRLSLAVACASVIAKVVRDRWMRSLDRAHPGYGFAVHKGYGTARHLEALRRLGPSPIHRRSFSPVRLAFPAA